MQKQWSFYDPFGRLYVIGFYHGQESGNFVLYINNNISIIDFNIKDDKAYSFIIGNRLLQLSIKKDTSGYDYNLKDTTPDPEYKGWEKIRDKIAAGVMVTVAIALVVSLGLIFAGVLP